MYKRLRFGLSSALILTMLLMAVVMVGNAVADDDDNCPVGQGYWKNTAQWPVVEIIIGGQVYTQAEMLNILNTPSEGDASLILARQIIAAKLNIANGQDPTIVQGVIDQADTLLATYASAGKLPFNIPPSSTDGQTLVNVATVADAYNNGSLTINCATPTPEATSESTPELTSTPEATLEVTPEVTPEATPESTPNPGDDDDGDIIIVIEGPVEAININIIVIYGIEIEINIDNPALTVIQIGDIVRVEGAVSDDDDDDDDDDGNKIIIIAVTIIIINVDINIDTGEAWRDSGDCGNPPPPWAPANGWRRRCEQGGGGNPGGGNPGGGNGRGNDDDDDDDD